VALDAAGNVYIADTWNYRIREVDTNDMITTVAGAGIAVGDMAATNAILAIPGAVATDASGCVYIADTDTNLIRKVTGDGIIHTIASNGSDGYLGDHGAATNAGLLSPTGVALDAAGNVYIDDNGDLRIRKVDSNGIITTVAGDGLFGLSGGGPATGDCLAETQGVASDPAGNLYIDECDIWNVIYKVLTNGTMTIPAGYGSNLLVGPGLDALGNLYLADPVNGAIVKVIATGNVPRVAGDGTSGFSGDGGAATSAKLNGPQGEAVDATGNMYIADGNNNRIRMVATNGIISTVAGSGPCGDGTGGYSGDGGAATNAGLDFPQGVALDGVGNLYIADSGNNRIREVHFAGFPTLALSSVSAGNAGNYTVIVSSPYGSVTAQVGTLAIASSNTPPQIITCDGFFGLLSNQFGFDLSGAAGQTIVVDGSTDLVNWTPLCTNAASGNPFYFCDPAWTNFPWRFYRARVPQ